jgi:hypothetical protein
MMMKKTNLITPPPELVNQWCHEDGDEIKTSPRWFRRVCAKAAQWGADQGVEAMMARMELKEQALKALTAINSNFHVHEPDASIIRRALEALDD